MRHALTILVLLVAGAANAQITLTSPFFGTWQNTDRRTDDITRMEISERAGQLKMQLWFKAGSGQFDAGLIDARSYTPSRRSGGSSTRTILRAQNRIRDTLEEYIVEQASGGQLTVTLMVIEGPRTGSYSRMTMRKYETPVDCIPYDPAALRVSGRTIIAGDLPLLNFSDGRDREMGLALARSYASVCNVGRDNVRTERKKYMFEYWEGGTNGATAPTYDCLPYDPARLRVTNIGAEGFRLESVTASGSQYLQLFDTQADANKGLEVFRRYSQQCFIGRGSSEVRGYLR